MMNLISFHGTITMVHDLPTGSNNEEEEGCYKLLTVEKEAGDLVNFIVSPDTYILGQIMLAIGDNVTGYYDGNAPAPLIFPPQYHAVIVVKDNPYQFVKVDFFNDDLISKDNQLQINISQATQMILTNGQPFFGNPANRNLIVIYGTSTKSIPAQTNPYQIIVLCL